MQIVHRDLKPDNVLYELQNPNDSHYHKDRVRVKLTDFGFATFFEKDMKTTKFVLGSYCYMAPEIFKGQRHS